MRLTRPKYLVSLPTDLAARLLRASIRSSSRTANTLSACSTQLRLLLRVALDSHVHLPMSTTRLQVCQRHVQFSHA